MFALDIMENSLRFRLKDSAKDIYGRRKTPAKPVKRSLTHIDNVKRESFESEFFIILSLISFRFLCVSRSCSSQCG